MARRIPIGPLVAGLGALVLLVSLFLDWYGEITAWTVFEVLDLVLAGIAIATLVSLAGALGLPRSAVTGGALLPLAAVALLLVVSQVLNHPPAGDGAEKEIGIWLALGATALMLAGAVLASARISLALDVQGREPAAPEEPPPAPEPRSPGPEPRP